ncbi:aspartyl-phosphate phosphatase Spo0E family protein [Paenibacillus illinoisensis]|uniref:aspartyl-phosphate phosphatase Spo0E family protein n=1 Tax=Paenibacillus illinoisensis TaxID=59845 RepID=UPI00301BFF87
MRLKRIQVRLEKERMELQALVDKHGINHPQVLKQSELVDVLINMYNNFSKTKYVISED